MMTVVMVVIMEMMMTKRLSRLLTVVGVCTLGLVSEASAGSLEIAPSVQNGVTVQNLQQIQVGFGVERQEAVLIQEQTQVQSRRSTPQQPRYQDQIPLDTDIRISPSIQNAVNVQNAQQLQLALPEVRIPRR